jgi:hypothetical protein
MHLVLLPWQQTVNVEHGRLKAQMGDLYPRWVGTRELLLNKRNPYGSDVSHEIQTAFYGHPIEQTYDKPENEIVDEQRFAYPVYVVFLLAPTLHMDFGELQTWAPIILGALVAISVWLWMTVLKWRLTPVAVTATILLVLSSPQIAQGLRLRQIGFLVAFLLALASWCVIRNRLFLAGVLLAISTIKPQLVLLCLVWFLVWSVGDWKKRWPLAAGFGITLGALIGAGELLLPGWPRYFLEGLDAYRKYFPTTSPIRLLLGNWMGGVISVLAFTVLLAYAWRRRRVPADSSAFLDVLALFFLASTLILPLLTPYNQILLLLPILRLIRDWKTLPRWGRSALIALMAWPAVVSFVLLLHRPDIHSPVRTPLLPSLLVLLTPFLVCLLLWMRPAEPSQLAN